MRAVFVNQFHFHNELLFDYIIYVAVIATLSTSFQLTSSGVMHILAGKGHRIIIIFFICISFSLAENTCTIHTMLSGYLVCRSVKLHINITGYVLYSIYGMFICCNKICM